MLSCRPYYPEMLKYIEWLMVNSDKLFEWLPQYAPVLYIKGVCRELVVVSGSHIRAELWQLKPVALNLITSKFWIITEQACSRDIKTTKAARSDVSVRRSQ